MLRTLVVASVAALAAGATTLNLALGCNASTPYPYQPRSLCTDAAFVQTITGPEASTLIQLHFASFSLPPTDYLVLSGFENGTRKDIFYYGQHIPHGASFNATPIFNRTITLSLYTGIFNPNRGGACAGFHIDYMITAVPGEGVEAQCGPKDVTMEAACFEGSPGIWRNAQAVARLVINRGGSLAGCTGWLLGNQGHFVTNNHCIKSAADAAGTRFEFKAQATKCPPPGTDYCKSQLACPGEIYSGSVQFVYTSSFLDYTIVKLDAWVAQKYNYLRLRARGPTLLEPIYIVEHPNAYGKRISNKNGDGIAQLRGPFTATQALYHLDTLPMASGSPILGVRDNLVVALHHGGFINCPNVGIRSELIFNDLKRVGLLPRDSWK
ncbi:hypothetical protein SPRG_08126 [Saprolegnia parasitica CBS 223.65]|uniref:Serine protease n=1 Tax=Saprolegnia parasitica (strain CBS 223.65) TaxID=695850 RepID=A0A067CCD1_SAPPC|nr:hypothetical protein SPRG_08126 [Saprolegnia parasitica CBS 223.65]KDO26835.1 hypothetical protein SPRG_08126 [Saprolegnia parasitica CBS 223.65]|eukprot:XP_012202481.1 hypothetical protein SPRG_08126 [Saprolegnia parasitica CBS 223.65]